MREITVEAVVKAPRETVSAHLSPETIMEYELTYEVLEVEADDDGWTVSTFANGDTGMVVGFEELPNGYAYRNVEGGFFEDLYTTVRVTEAEDAPSSDGGSTETAGSTASPAARVVFYSEFTFGGFLAPLIDRLATRQRRKELERVLYALGEAIEEVESTEEAISETSD